MTPSESDAHRIVEVSQADAELTIAAAAQAASHALRAGMKAPLFTLADTAGESVALDDLLCTGPVMLHFIRGAWCAFGEQSLVDFAAMQREVVALGASAVAIAPEMPGIPRVTGLPVRELRDVDMRVSRQFGLAFNLPRGLRDRYMRLGYSPPCTRAPDEWPVPLPATYLVDREGTVVLAFVDADYRNPFDSASLLSALKALQTRGRYRHRLAAKRRDQRRSR